jgi:hypothetical protein
MARSAYGSGPTTRATRREAERLYAGAIMAGLLVLLFPLVLLGFMLFMQRVEEPLNKVAVERQIEQFLDDANSDELDTFVREGTDSALSRFRQRLSLRRLRPGRRR